MMIYGHWGGLSRQVLLYHILYTCIPSTTEHLKYCNLPVAIETNDSLYRQEFLAEIALMKTLGRHSHVVSILGCCTQDNPLWLLVEHMPHGDLLHYLRGYRRSLQEVGKPSQNTTLYTDQESISGTRYKSNNSCVVIKM